MIQISPARARAVLAIASLLSIAAAGAADTEMLERYRRAADYLPWQVSTWLPQPEAFAATWSPDGRQFAYRAPATTDAERRDGEWILGNSDTGTLKRTSRQPRFEVAPAPAVTLSPDGQSGIGLEGFNLWRVASDGKRIALTTDGTEGDAYAPLYSFGVIAESERAALRGPMRPAQGAWSSDGRFFATYRYDQRGVRTQLYWNAAPAGQYGLRPEVVAQASPYPGEHNAVATLMVCEVAAGVCKPIAAASFETFLDPFSAGLVRWAADSGSLYFLHEAPGLRSVTLHRWSALDGRVTRLFEESSPTYLMLSGSRYPAIWAVLDGGRSLLWFSERDGWGNLYRIDLRDGSVRNAVTRGPGVTRSLVRVDERQGWVYFVASGREPERDPYFRHFYRARLDGSKVELLTPERADHVVSIPESGDVFIDVQSSAFDALPHAVLRHLSNGAPIAALNGATLTPLEARGWNPPQRVRVRSADDRYDVYVTVFKPSQFAPGERLPVVDYIYGIASLARTPAAFPLSGQFELGSYFWQAQAVAELGFAVVMLDGPGTPLRGYAFARESYGAGHVDSTLAHHVAAIRQLAARDASLDLARVGIFGKSGGGFASTRAMLLYPDFFKVAVSVAGAHDLVRLYAPEWGERYIGAYEQNREVYRQLSNATFADRLRGKLLLVHGEADSEVSIAMTQQLVHALIAANRNFDLLYVPGRDHDLDDDPYTVRRRWDYLVTHLLGREPPADFRIPAPAGAH